jgi:hypothetical protein
MHQNPIRTKLITAVENALVMTQQRRTGVSDGLTHAMYTSIHNQLQFMHHTVASGAVPTLEEKNRLTLGVIAVREFETPDVEYCDALCNVVFDFKKL